MCWPPCQMQELPGASPVRSDHRKVHPAIVSKCGGRKKEPSASCFLSSDQLWKTQTLESLVLTDAKASHRWQKGSLPDVVVWGHFWQLCCGSDEGQMWLDNCSDISRRIISASISERSEQLSSDHLSLLTSASSSSFSSLCFRVKELRSRESCYEGLSWSLNEWVLSLQQKMVSDSVLSGCA